MSGSLSVSTSAASGGSSSVVSPHSGGAKFGSLDTIVKSVDTSARGLALLTPYALKATAAKLLRSHDEKQGARISACRYTAFAPDVELVRNERADAPASAHFSGVVSCHSVWCCAICSAKISRVRRDEMNVALAWARLQGYSVAMLTLTARHNAKTDLAAFLSDLKGAQKRFRQSRGWRSLPLVGSIVATEVTHGRNGWHPHGHILLIFDAPSSDALAAVEGLRSEWSRSLFKVGRDCNAAGFQCQNATAAGNYIAKWGAAEELTLGKSKLGRGSGSRSPWQLLADAGAGDKRACALWVEFALAFKSRRQLVWSRGLKVLAGVNEVSDDVAADAEADADPVTLRAWPGCSDDWRSARRRSASLLFAASTGGNLNAAEFGPTDSLRWRADLAASVLIEE
jgi:hypothetical protein